MKESAKRQTRNHSMHSVRNDVSPKANNTYELDIADFSETRCINSKLWLKSLVSKWNKERPFIEYYSTLDFLPNKKLQCAEVLNCWLEDRVIRGKVKIVGPYSRHLNDVIHNAPSFDIALKGIYNHHAPNDAHAKFEYTQITGLRFVFPDLRRW